MRHLTIALVCLLALALASPVLAAQERRVALVIGNSAYKTSPLKNPVHDARDMANVLRKLGFTVIQRENATLKQMEDGIKEFWESLRKGGVGLFYYAGHGVQVAGDNYLVPVDAKLEVEKDTRYECVDAGKILARMEDAGNDLNIVILDACRTNPFARKFRSSERGLARMDAPAGSILAYATAPGTVAADGETRNGMYTNHLLQIMQTPGLPVEQVFKRVRDSVMRETGSKQVPWESTSLRGDFYFAGPPPDNRPLAAMTPQYVAPPVQATPPAAPLAQAPAPPKPEEPKKSLGEFFAGLFKPRDSSLSQDLAPAQQPASPPTAPAPTPKAEPAPTVTKPPKEQLDLNELKRKAEAQARAEAETRREWAAWQARMRKDMAEVQVLERDRHVPAAIKLEAWQKLAATYAADNPFSDEDDALRRKIDAQVSHWAARAGTTAPPKEPEQAVETPPAAAPAAQPPAQTVAQVVAAIPAPAIAEPAPPVVEQPAQASTKKEWTLMEFLRSLFRGKEEPAPEQQTPLAARSLPEVPAAPVTAAEPVCPERSKKQWRKLLSQMKSDFAKAQAFEKRKSVSADDKAEAWRVLAADYACECPYSREDRKLREKMDARAQYWSDKAGQ